MSRWPSSKARVVFQALLHAGWSVKRHAGTSHRILAKPGWPDFVFAFLEGDEIGPKMLSRIARQTGLTSEEL